MRSAKPLSVKAVAQIDKPGWQAVGDGAYLQISKDEGRSWLFRYQRDGKARAMGLGPFGLVSLAEAREKARTARKLLKTSIMPPFLTPNYRHS